MHELLLKRLAFIAMIMGLYTLFTTEINLHCTQYTSFSIAVFDMEPHMEETNPIPFVYYPTIGIFIRVILALYLIALAIAPGITTILKVKNTIKSSQSKLFLVLLAFLSIFFITLQPIFGERFAWMIMTMLFYFSIQILTLKILDKIFYMTKIRSEKNKIFN